MLLFDDDRIGAVCFKLTLDFIIIICVDLNELLLLFLLVMVLLSLLLLLFFIILLVFNLLHGLLLDLCLFNFIV